MYTATLRYHDPKTHTQVVHRDAELIYSGSGCAGPVYHEVYRLADGNYLSGVRHDDDPAELTDVCYSATKAGVMARRPLLH